MKKIFLICGFFIGITTSLFAQVAVLETNSALTLMTAINSLYSTYDEINNMIEQVQQGYEQINAAYQQMANMDWDALTEEGSWSEEGGLQGAWDNIGNARKNVRDKTSFISNNIAQLKAAKEQMLNSSISFGGTDFTLADLCGAGDSDKTVFNLLDNIATQQFDNYAKIGKAASGEMTDEEKADAYAKWGMSPDLVSAVNTASVLATGAIDDILSGVSDSLEAANAGSLAEETETLMKMADAAGKSGSEVETARINIEASAGIMKQINNLNSGFKKCFAAWGASKKKDDIEKEALARQRALDYKKQQAEAKLNTNREECHFGK